jgi:hypothetical protein
MVGQCLKNGGSWGGKAGDLYMFMNFDSPHIDPN